MSNQRNQVVDTARALGIILVVLGHNFLVARDLRSLHDWSYSFHMPLFMALSGIFFSPGSLSAKAIQNKALSLLAPYFTASFVSAIVASLGKKSVEDVLASMGHIMLRSVLSAPGTIEWVPLWFLPHLFLVHLVASIIHATVKNPILISVLGALRACVGQSVFFETGLPWSADLLPVTCGYFLLGHFIFPKVKDALLHPERGARWGIVFDVSWAATFILLTPAIDLYLRIYSGLSAFLAASAGCSFALCLCGAIQKWRSLSAVAGNVGRHSIYIFLFHVWRQGKVTGSRASRMNAMWPPVFFGAAAAVTFSVAAERLIERSTVLRPFFVPAARGPLDQSTGGNKQTVEN